TGITGAGYGCSTSASYNPPDIGTGRSSVGLDTQVGKLIVVGFVCHIKTDTVGSMLRTHRHVAETDIVCSIEHYRCPVRSGWPVIGNDCVSNTGTNKADGV